MGISRDARPHPAPALRLRLVALARKRAPAHVARLGAGDELARHRQPSCCSLLPWALTKISGTRLRGRVEGADGRERDRRRVVERAQRADRVGGDPRRALARPRARARRGRGVRRLHAHEDDAQGRARGSRRCSSRSSSRLHELYGHVNDQLSTPMSVGVQHRGGAVPGRSRARSSPSAPTTSPARSTTRSRPSPRCRSAGSRSRSASCSSLSGASPAARGSSAACTTRTALGAPDADRSDRRAREGPAVARRRPPAPRPSTRRSWIRWCRGRLPHVQRPARCAARCAGARSGPSPSTSSCTGTATARRGTARATSSAPRPSCWRRSLRTRASTSPTTTSASSTASSPRPSRRGPALRLRQARGPTADDHDARLDAALAAFNRAVTLNRDRTEAVYALAVHEFARHKPDDRDALDGDRLPLRPGARAGARPCAGARAQGDGPDRARRRTANRACASQSGSRGAGCGGSSSASASAPPTVDSALPGARANIAAALGTPRPVQPRPGRLGARGA